MVVQLICVCDHDLGLILLQNSGILVVERDNLGVGLVCLCASVQSSQLVMV